MPQSPNIKNHTTAQNGICPEGFRMLFGGVCLEDTILSKIEDALPELPHIELEYIHCEAIVTTLQEAVDNLNKALEFPLKLLKMAQELIEKPFDAAVDIVNSTMKIFDDISNAIDKLLADPMSMIKDFTDAVNRFLDCPFMADTPLAKTCAEILDAMEAGLPYHELLSSLKNQIGGVAKNYINKAKKVPLSTIGQMEKMYNDIIKRLEVGKVLKFIQNLEECIKAFCNMAEVITQLPARAETYIEKLGGYWDEMTGEFKATFVRAYNTAEERAVQLAKDLTIIRLAGTP